MILLFVPFQKHQDWQWHVCLINATAQSLSQIVISVELEIRENIRLYTNVRVGLRGENSAHFSRMQRKLLSI